MLFCVLLLIFFLINLPGTPSVSNSLDPDKARRYIGPDLGPNWLQMLSADDPGSTSLYSIQSYS